MSDKLAKREDVAPAREDSPKGPDPEVIQRFLEFQAKELEIRKQEIEVRREELVLRQQESAQGFEFAKSSLTVQAADLKEVRSQGRRDSTFGFIVVIACLVVLGAVVFYCLSLNKEQFVLELARVVLAALGGGGVGYVVGNRKAKQETEEEK